MITFRSRSIWHLVDSVATAISQSYGIARSRALTNPMASARMKALSTERGTIGNGCTGRTHAGRQNRRQRAEAHPLYHKRRSRTADLRDTPIRSRGPEALLAGHQDQGEAAGGLKHRPKTNRRSTTKCWTATCVISSGFTPFSSAIGVLKDSGFASFVESSARFCVLPSPDCAAPSIVGASSLRTSCTRRAPSQQ